MTLGERIRQLREKRHLSQNKLAQLSGLSQASLSRVENNIAKDLRGTNACRVASALRIPIDALLSDNAPAPQHLVDHDSEAAELVVTFAGMDENKREQVLQFARYLHALEIQK